MTPSSRRRHPSDNKLFFAFLVLLVWLPLPLGSNRPWAWHLLEFLAFILCAWWLLLFVRGKVHATAVLHNSHGLFICLGGFAALILLQLIPLPIEWVAGLRFVDPAIETSTSATISIDPHISWIHLRQTLAFIAMAFLLLALVNTPTRLRQLALALLIAGVLQAVYGSLMTLSDLEYGFFIKKERFLGVATGTFWNRNHLANYLILCLAMGIGLLLSELYQQPAINPAVKQR